MKIVVPFEPFFLRRARLNRYLGYLKSGLTTHQPCEMGQILGWKILDLPCQHHAGVMLTKTFLTYL